MEGFTRDFELILKSDFGREVGEASVKELYNAVSKAVMLDIYDDWRKSRERAASVAADICRRSF